MDRARAWGAAKMIEQSAPQPFTVSASPIPDLAASNLRVVLIAFGAWAIGHGWFTQGTFDTLIPIALILVPWVWGQVKGFLTHDKLASVAADPRVPDAVIRLK